MEYDFSKGKRGAVIPLPPGKERITIRLDADILDWFRQQALAQGGQLPDHDQPGPAGIYGGPPVAVGRAGTALPNPNSLPGSFLNRTK